MSVLIKCLITQCIYIKNKKEGKSWKNLQNSLFKTHLTCLICLSFTQVMASWKLIERKLNFVKGKFNVDLKTGVDIEIWVRIIEVRTKNVSIKESSNYTTDKGENALI